MLIVEVLSAPVSWKWTTKPTAHVARASFVVGSERYVVTFEQDYQRIGVPRGDEPFTAQYLCFFRQTTVPKKRSEDITGTGNAFVVFSTVLQIIDALRHQMPHSSVTFFAREPSRISLYTKMFARRYRNVQVEKIGDARFTIPPLAPLPQ